MQPKLSYYVQVYRWNQYSKINNLFVTLYILFEVTSMAALGAENIHTFLKASIQSF
jgi:hypothetical protein